MEFDFRDRLFLRMGVNNFQRDNNFFTRDFLTVQPNIGVGLKLGKFQVDYAFTDVGEQRNQTYSHVISILLNINPR